MKMQIKFLTFILALLLIVGGCSNAVGSQTVPGSETNSQDNNPLQGIPISAVEPDIFTLQLGVAVQGTVDYHDINSMAVLVNKQNKLPADYVPTDLVETNIPFASYVGSEQKLLRQEAAENLEALFAEAEKNGLILYGVSGYRSYQTQKAIFNNNVRKYGDETKANKISARPGESEHQTGLVMDVTSQSVAYSLVTYFADTAEYSWLKDNAHHYGFIIRYPQGKEIITGYIFEPWHLRYVGKDLAKILYENNLTYEEYLFFAI
ncbi:MAG: M15 family metallopeptidase [Peptococcaceae bacterium]|nr:M15 family metallopeptidase [Peptococcaceae bacterium]